MLLSLICRNPSVLPTDFLFLCDFLAAISPSAVHLYGDDGEITASASKCNSPLCVLGLSALQYYSTDKNKCDQYNGYADSAVYRGKGFALYYALHLGGYLRRKLYERFEIE